MKAIELLNNDRKEMRYTTDKLQKLITCTVDEIKEKLETDIINRINEIETKYSKQIQELSGKIVILENEINYLKLTSENKHYMYIDALVYQNIFEALEKGII